LNYDYLVIGGYFLLVVGIGFAFKTMAKQSTSDYFRGGGRMLWWMVGSTRFRQMRVDTPTEAIRRRFGHENELFFSWALIIFSLINAGIWLNALGVFSSAVFEADITLTIVATGLTVVFVSVVSGAWGVVASDFVQTLTVAVVSLACALVALVKVGGPVALVANFPSNFLIGPNMNYPLLLVGTFVFFLVKQLVTIMNLHDSFRGKPLFSQWD